MTSADSPLSSPPAAGVETPEVKRNLLHLKKAIWLRLSAEDRESSHVLTSNLILLAERDWGSKGHKRRITEAFASPSYSIDLKKWLAIASVHRDLILLLGDAFLTEEIILTYVEQPQNQNYGLAYLEALMVSSHLSERIIKAACFRAGMIENDIILGLTPVNMITPSLISRWLWIIQWRYGRMTNNEDSPSFAARRIREAHPEYEGFPDDWVLKVFCGNESGDS